MKYALNFWKAIFVKTIGRLSIVELNDDESSDHLWTKNKRLAISTKK